MMRAKRRAVDMKLVTEQVCMERAETRRSEYTTEWWRSLAQMQAGISRALQ